MSADRCGHHRDRAVTVVPCLGCGMPTRNGPRCPACRLTRAHELEYKRGTRQARGYSNAWLRVVKDAIAAQPWCSVPGCRNPDLTGDHLIPLSRGGASIQENCGVLCRRHNSARGAREWSTWLAQQAVG